MARADGCLVKAALWPVPALMLPMLTKRTTVPGPVTTPSPDALPDASFVPHTLRLEGLRWAGLWGVTVPLQLEPIAACNGPRAGWDEEGEIMSVGRTATEVLRADVW